MGIRLLRMSNRLGSSLRGDGMPQSYLDEFVEIKVERKEKVEERVEEGMGRGDVVEERVEVIGEVEEVEESKESEEMNVIADLKDPEHRSRCPYCGEWVGRLHGGALHLYVKRGRLFALTDMDHVYKDRRHGLMDNIRFYLNLSTNLLSNLCILLGGCGWKSN